MLHLVSVFIYILSENILDQNDEGEKEEAQDMINADAKIAESKFLDDVMLDL